MHTQRFLLELARLRGRAEPRAPLPLCSQPLHQVRPLPPQHTQPVHGIDRVNERHEVRFREGLHAASRKTTPRRSQRRQRGCTHLASITIRSRMRGAADLRQRTASSAARRSCASKLATCCSPAARSAWK